MSELRVEWAVRWPGGEVEECATLERAQQILRLHVEPELVGRTIIVGDWEPVPPPTADAVDHS